MRSGIASAILNASSRQLGGVYAKIMPRSLEMSAKSFREKSAKDFLSKFWVILGWFFGCKIGVGGYQKNSEWSRREKNPKKFVSDFSGKNLIFGLDIFTWKTTTGGLIFYRVLFYMYNF